MGTWTNDIAGQGLAHTRPLTHAELVRARRIQRRWHEWSPLIIHHLRQRNASSMATELERMKQVHERTMTRLLDAGIHITRIINPSRKVLMDDPRLTDEEREQEIARAIRYSQARRKKVTHDEHK